MGSLFCFQRAGNSMIAALNYVTMDEEFVLWTTRVFLKLNRKALIYSQIHHKLQGCAAALLCIQSKVHASGLLFKGQPKAGEQAARAAFTDAHSRVENDAGWHRFLKVSTALCVCRWLLLARMGRHCLLARGGSGGARLHRLSRVHLWLQP